MEQLPKQMSETRVLLDQARCFGSGCNHFYPVVRLTHRSPYSPEARLLSGSRTRLHSIIKIKEEPTSCASFGPRHKLIRENLAWPGLGPHMHSQSPSGQPSPVGPMTKTSEMFAAHNTTRDRRSSDDLNEPVLLPALPAWERSGRTDPPAWLPLTRADMPSFECGRWNLVCVHCFTGRTTQRINN